MNDAESAPSPKTFCRKLGILNAALNASPWAAAAGTNFEPIRVPGLKNGFESGKYFEIYEKWFGPKGELPYPITPQVKAYLLKQIGK